LPPSKTLQSTLIWKSHADIDFDSKATVFQHGKSQKPVVNIKGQGGTWGLDKTVVFASRICMATLYNGNVRITDIGKTSVEHLSYSLDLTPCNCWALPMLKYDIYKDRNLALTVAQCYHSKPIEHCQKMA